MLRKLRTLVPTIGSQSGHGRRLLQHGKDHLRRAVPILHAGRVNPVRKRDPFDVNRNMTLAALALLACIIARRASVLRRLHG